MDAAIDFSKQPTQWKAAEQVEFGMPIAEIHHSSRPDWSAEALRKFALVTTRARVAEPAKASEALFDSAERYARLRTNWKVESAPLSWLEDILACPSARLVRRMGEQAVPHLARDLAAQPEGSLALMALLRELLGDGPEIPDDEAGRRDAMRARWLAWLTREGRL